MLGVVKNIIPAIGSTNAMVAALSVVEAVKLVSKCAQITDNYAYLGGGAGFSTVLQSLVLEDLTGLPLNVYVLAVSSLYKSLTFGMYRVALVPMVCMYGCLWTRHITPLR